MSKGQKNLKKAKKILKAKAKAGYAKIANFQNFFCFLGSIGSKNLYARIFLVSEAIKVKKAKQRPQHRKYVRGQLKLSKFGVPIQNYQFISA